MAVSVGTPIAVVTPIDTWVEFQLLDLSGNPLSGVDLSTIVMWTGKQNATSLVSKTVTPNITLKEVGQGTYSVLMTAAELDTVGLALLVVEAPTASQSLSFLYVIQEEGQESGIPQNSESWLPYRAISGFAATGVTGLTTVDSVHYKKSGDNAQVAKVITPATDFRELGRGLYAIRFSTTELDTSGPFQYNVLRTGSDQFSFYTDLVVSGNNRFEFTVELDGNAAVGYDIQVRRATDLSLIGTVTTDTQGKAEVFLPIGEYYATLVQGSVVFDKNNILFEVSEQDGANCLQMDAAGITPTPSVSPPGVSTGAATIQDPLGHPISGLTVTVSIRRPALQGGILYMGTRDLITDHNGQVSGEFAQGNLITVNVEGTNINREFEVPTSAFNLISAALDVADPFTVQTPNFPAAPIHTI